MTVVVGVQSEGGVWLGWDGCISMGSYRTTCAGKAFEIGHGVWLGIAGYSGPPELLQASITIKAPPKTGDPQSWIVRQLYPSIRRPYRRWRDAADADGMSTRELRESSNMEFLVVVRGQLFHGQLPQGYVVQPTYGYSAVGSGSDVAIGALAATDGMEPHERLRVALAASCRHGDGVSEPTFTQWVPL